MIKIDKLTKYYGKNESRFKALDGVSLTIENGEFVVNKGTATIYVGDQAPDKRSEALTGKGVLNATIKISETKKL